MILIFLYENQASSSKTEQTAFNRALVPLTQQVCRPQLGKDLPTIYLGIARNKGCSLGWSIIGSNSVNTGLMLLNIADANAYRCMAAGLRMVWSCSVQLVHAGCQQLYVVFISCTDNIKTLNAILHLQLNWHFEFKSCFSYSMNIYSANSIRCHSKMDLFSQDFLGKTPKAFCPYVMTGVRRRRRR